MSAVYLDLGLALALVSAAALFLVRKMTRRLPEAGVAGSCCSDDEVVLLRPHGKTARLKPK